MGIKMIDHKIETFLVLCEQLNYQKAADKLNLTQLAVTQQIMRLEEEYSCKLFKYDKENKAKNSPKL